ncbi:MAG: biotin/lipoyl-binding protein, partial [Cyanobacteria bacterium P01_H01_bin.119]
MQSESALPKQLLIPMDIEAPNGSKPEPSASQQSARPKLQLKRWQVMSLLPLVLLPVGAIAANKLIGSAASEADSSQTIPVQAVTVEAVDGYAVGRSYSGELVAGRTSDLSFELAGKVVEILVDEGEAVSTGEPLARLDTRSLQAQRQQLVAQRDQAIARLQELEAGPRSQDIAAARAAVADLQNQVDLARLQETRRQSLYERGAISREELDQQTFGTGSLESRLQQAQSTLEELLEGTRTEQVAAQAAAVRQL